MSGPVAALAVGVDAASLVSPVELVADGVVLQPPVDDEDSLELLALLVGGFLVGLYFLYDGFDTWQTYRLIKDTPTANVRSMAVGRTELEGTVREDHTTVDPPYTTDECVYVSWEAERREKYRDEDGNTKYRWETVADGTEAVRFQLEDATGRVLVRGDAGAEFDIFDDAKETTVTYSRGEAPPAAVTGFMKRARKRWNTEDPEAADDDGLFESAVDLVTDAMQTDEALTDTSNRRRYSQTVLPVGSEVYVFGSAEPRDDGEIDAGQEDLLEIRRDTGSDEFLVVDAEEERVQSRYSKLGPAKTIGGLVLSAVTLYLLVEWYYVPLTG